MPPSPRRRRRTTQFLDSFGIRPQAGPNFRNRGAGDPIIDNNPILPASVQRERDRAAVRNLEGGPPTTEDIFGPQGPPVSPFEGGRLGAPAPAKRKTTSQGLDLATVAAERGIPLTRRVKRTATGRGGGSFLPPAVSEFYGLRGTARTPGRLGRMGGTARQRNANRERLAELKPEVDRFMREQGISQSGGLEAVKERLAEFERTGGQSGAAGGTGSFTDQLSAMVRRVLSQQVRDKEEAKRLADAAMAKISGLIDQIGEGQAAQFANELGRLALEAAANPGISDREVSLTFNRILEEDIQPGFASARRRVSEAGGPGARGQLGRLSLGETGEKIRTSRDLRLAQLESGRTGRLEAAGLLGQAAALKGGQLTDKVNAMLTLESLQDRRVEDRAGPLVETLAAQDPAAAFAAVSGSFSGGGGGTLRPGLGGGVAGGLLPGVSTGGVSGVSRGRAPFPTAGAQLPQPSGGIGAGSFQDARRAFTNPPRPPRPTSSIGTGTFRQPRPRPAAARARQPRRRRSFASA